MIIVLNERIESEQAQFFSIFGSIVSSIDNISESEFDNLIKYAEEKNWKTWESAFRKWKAQGFIDTKEFN